MPKFDRLLHHVSEARARAGQDEIAIFRHLLLDALSDADGDFEPLREWIETQYHALQVAWENGNPDSIAAAERLLWEAIEEAARSVRGRTRGMQTEGGGNVDEQA